MRLSDPARPDRADVNRVTFRDRVASRCPKFPSMSGVLPASYVTTATKRGASEMKSIDLRALIFAITSLGYGGLASAAVHAPANTAITNTANVDYDVGGNPQPTVNSNTDTITVDELVDVDAALQSASPVIVLTGSADQPIRFRITNLGNGSEQFNLGANLALGGDQFDPTGAQFYIDDGDGIFEPGAGDGGVVTSITLAGEAFGDVWLAADIPAALADGNLGNVSVTATSNTGTGAAGSAFAGAGTGGVDAVIGNSGGDDVDTAAYQVSNIAIVVTKTSTIVDPFAGSQPIPGATITYTVTVTSSGTGSATNVNVTDDFPANTTYVLNSITVNTIAKTDLNDAEAAPACDTTTNAGGIYCLLGTLTGATTNTVTFKVTIN
jgi:uncharacterized repeat protein (TIGR01451 family)